MTKAQRIEEYIKECFKTYCIDITEFFSVVIDDEVQDICWTESNGKINMKAVQYASELLGISVDDILARNNDAMAKWWQKYPYLWHLHAYNHAYESTFYGKGYESIKLVEAIFDTKLDQPYPSRYDIKDIARRLDNELKEIDKSLPGTYHKGAHITNLSVTTDNFFEFDEIEEMTESFINIINAFKSLTLKALNDELAQDEIYEFNFLSTVLGFRDRFYVKGFLRYNDLVFAKAIYADVTEQNFDDYFVFRKEFAFRPWCCTGFINNRALVEKYLSVIPTAKAEMRQFSELVSQFYCSFIWSDAELIEPDPETEAFFGKDEFDEPIKQRTTLYIPKNTEEYGNGAEYANVLIEYCRPAKLGGIPVKTPTNSRVQLFEHFPFMMQHTFANTFQDWCSSHSTGGDANE